MHERDQQTSDILAAAIEVHRTLGHGFLEAVYSNALVVELALRAIDFRTELRIPVYYKETKLNCGYSADFLCFGEVLVELKAQSALSPVDEAQVINYLRATGLKRALLLNFGTPRLQIKRLILSDAYRTKEQAGQVHDLGTIVED